MAKKKAAQPAPPPPKKLGPQPCQVCGDMIPVPVSRDSEKPVYVCNDCYSPLRQPPRVNLDQGASVDRSYHGGQFHSGEW